MSRTITNNAHDAGLRALGAVLLLLCWVLFRWLFYSAGPAHHDLTFLSYAAAALGFVSFSLGSAFLALGRHIFDEVEVSARWAVRPPINQGLDLRNSGEPPFRLVSEREFGRVANASSLEEIAARRRAEARKIGNRDHG